MSEIILGYGEYEGCKIRELPASALAELATRYPLQRDDNPEYETLLITIAIHGELERRKVGGAQERRLPTIRELAEEIVNKGYAQASKQHHPDANGHHESQLRLTKARDFLRSSCAEMNDISEFDNPTIIPAPASARSRGQSARSSNVSDDDCPF
jgi:hypothetical protein